MCNQHSGIKIHSHKCIFCKYNEKIRTKPAPQTEVFINVCSDRYALLKMTFLIRVNKKT